MYIPLDRDSATPLTRQISAYLEELIRRGHLGGGAQLPATRALARRLGVNKKTVEVAYDELKARRLVHIRAGRGVTVRSGIPETTELDLPFRRGRFRDPLPARAWISPFEPPEPAIDLAGDGPSLLNVSPRALRSFYEAALASRRAPLFSPAPLLGETALRAAASRHFARCGILRSPDDVAIFGSRREAIARILELFVSHRGLVGILPRRDPDHVRAVRTLGLRIRTEEASASRRRRDPRLVIAATGATRLPGPALGPADRRALLDRAREGGFPILEDVTDTEWLAEGPTPPPLSVLDAGGRVVPLCDLSDELGGPFTAAAIGATPKLLERLRRSHPCGTELPRLSQRVLAQALDFPGRARSRRAVRERRRLLLSAVTRTLRRRIPASLGHEFSQGGDAVRVDLPEGITGRALQAEALTQGVAVLGALDWGASPARDDAVLLELTRAEEGELLEGIRRLGSAFDTLEERTDAEASNS